MGVDVVGDRIQPVGRVGKYGGAYLFECACQDIHVFEVFDLQARSFPLFAVVGERLVFFGAGELRAHRFVFFALKVAAGEDDVGQFRVLFVKGDAKQRGGGRGFVRVVHAVVIGGVATDVLQAADGAAFGEVATIYYLGFSGVNDFAVFLAVVRRRGFRFWLRCGGICGWVVVAAVVIAATAGDGAECDQDGDREVRQFHSVCSFR